MSTEPNVAFCRPLHKGMRGADIRAHKRALSRAEPVLYPWMDFTFLFGDRFERAIKVYQKKHSIQATGRIGSKTHERLEHTYKHGTTKQWAFDATAISWAKDFCAEFTKTPEQRVRQDIVNAAFYWYSHRGNIAYSQYRPMQLGKPPWVPSRLDCSGFVTCCHYAGDAHDPNNRGYDHLGYTGTLMSTGTRVGNVSQLDIGDAIFFGFTTHSSPAFPYGSPTHVALYVGVISGTHSILSLGSYPMKLLPYNYRAINHLRHYEVT